jgi:hypothetical protein
MPPPHDRSELVQLWPNSSHFSVTSAPLAGMISIVDCGKDHGADQIHCDAIVYCKRQA